MFRDINLEDASKLKKAFNSLQIRDNLPEIEYIFFTNDTNDYNQPIILFVEDFGFDPYFEDVESIEQSLKLDSRIGEIMKDIFNTDDWASMTIDLEDFKNEESLKGEGAAYIEVYKK